MSHFFDAKEVNFVNERRPDPELRTNWCLFTLVHTFALSFRHRNNFISQNSSLDILLLTVGAAATCAVYNALQLN